MSQYATEFLKDFTSINMGDPKFARNINILDLQAYPQFFEYKGRTKRIWHHSHGLEWGAFESGTLASNEGLVEPGTFLQLGQELTDGVYETVLRAFRWMIFSEVQDTGGVYNIIKTHVGQEDDVKRFRKGLEVAVRYWDPENAIDGWVDRYVGEIVSIDRETGTIVVNGDVGQDVQGELFIPESILHVEDGEGETAVTRPRLVGISGMFSRPTPIEHEDDYTEWKQAPVLYIRHAYIIAQKVTWYDVRHMVENQVALKVKQELPLLQFFTSGNVSSAGSL